MFWTPNGFAILGRLRKTSVYSEVNVNSTGLPPRAAPPISDHNTKASGPKEEPL